MQAIPIYIINLKRNPERKLFMQRQLDAFNLDYQFVEAIDKYDLESRQCRARIVRSLGIDETNLEHKYSRFIGRFKVDEGYGPEGLGQLACLLSHIKAYNLILKNNDSTACILEDDTYLLPTFSAVLKVATESSWDILMLANNQPSNPHGKLIQPNYIKRVIHIRMFNRDLLLIHKKTKNRNFAKKQKSRLERLLKEYGFNAPTPEQSEIFAKALQEHDTKYEKIIEITAPNNRRLSLIKHEQYRIYRTLRKHIRWHTLVQLGALPDKTSLELITKHHCIAKSSTEPLSAMAYLLKQSATVKWKQQALAENSLSIDEIPWQLYKNEQVKLRLITPPCAAAAYHYLIDYSARRR